MTIAKDYIKPKVTKNWGRHLLAGGLAGAISRTVTAPLDRIKINLQMTQSKYRLVPFVMDMYKEGGLAAFWRGNGVNLIKIAPETAIKFSFNEIFKDYLVRDMSRQLTLFERFSAGATAGSLSQTAIYPLEVLKTRLALGKTGEYNGIIHAMREVYSAGGVKSFYRGYLPNLLGNVPYAGIELTVYEGLRHYSREGGGKPPPTILQSIFFGVTATMMGQLVTYPLSLTKNRLVAEGGSSTARGYGNTMSEVLRKEVQNYGFLGLYRGFGVNATKVCPAVSITYAVLEILRHLMGITSS